MFNKKNEKHSAETAQHKPLRVWPCFVAVILILMLRYVVPLLAPEALDLKVFGQLILGLFIFVWWAFLSRAPRFDRWGGFLLMIVALVVTRFFLHESIRMAGIGFLYPILAIPIMGLVFGVSVLATHRFSHRLRRSGMVAAILIVCFGWLLIQTGGVDASLNHDFAWRWVEMPEERLLSSADDEHAVLSEVVIPADLEALWPGFRGSARDGIVRGVSIDRDWSVSPPKELWRRPVGPGWSSFAVIANLFYTQEQRGEKEAVSCYDLATGRSVWMHEDEARFWESNGGAGPRGTPTISRGRIYSFGGTGIINVLNAATGAVVWSRNAAADTDTKTPIWGFSSSPLVLENRVIVAAAGSLIAYDIETGEPRWSKPTKANECYSSPQLLHIDGVEQVLLQNAAGVISLSPSDGNLVWEHVWAGCPIVQPAQLADGDILVSVDDKSGVRRIQVAQGPDGWTVKEDWTSDGVKPYFNDSVIHKGYIYGFDGRSLSCIDVEKGERQWKGGRYGRGQFILLADQDLLLVISEKGDLVLVEAVPEQFTELARIPAIKGKTWNHPVLAGDILLVRNGAEMAAFRLSGKSG